MVSLLMNLQQTVAKQQLLLKLLLLHKQKAYNYNSKEANAFVKSEDMMVEEKPSQENFKIPPLNFVNKYEMKVELREHTKMHETNSIMVKREESLETEASEEFIHKGMSSTELSAIIEESGSDEEEHRRKREAKVIRRNGFKAENKFDDVDGESEGGSDGGPRKSNKMIIPKRPPSKAKHLWINYGRKIIEFAVNHTKDDVQSRIKQLIGKLSSKKDFEDVFEIKPTDSECEKAFKVLFGKLALYFIKFKADAAFEGSKYREQMVTQKTIVATWVSKLTSEPY
jgi:hypothetical protein